MGCDIHLFVEEQTNTGWRHIASPAQLAEAREKPPEVELQTWLDATDTAARLAEHNHRETFDAQYGRRNYAVFSLLADVRNGRGGGHIKPISEARGMPEDVSPGVSELQWDGDDHSHSWLTDVELISYIDELTEYDHPDGYPALVRMLYEHPVPTRIVFWFDN
jgi:hypothetical protein